MLHRPCLSAAFFSQLRVLDRHIAEQVHASGCRHCGHRLHVANYPRKPRGIEHRVLGEGYRLRWSFCCSRCRRRTTPPSLRFLGRKVYLGALLVLFGNVAADAAPSGAMFRAVAKRSGIPPLTLARWHRWWTQAVPATRWWRSLRSRFVPSPESERLPLSLLERVAGDEASGRLTTVLALTGPLSTRTCSHFPRVVVDTHEML